MSGLVGDVAAYPQAAPFVSAATHRPRSDDSQCTGECGSCVGGKCWVPDGGNCTSTDHFARAASGARTTYTFGRCTRAPPSPPPPGPVTGAGMLFFFDGKWLSAATNVARALGTPELLATFADPVSFVGWGCHSVWRDGAKTRLMYEANFNHSHREHPGSVCPSDIVLGVRVLSFPLSSRLRHIWSPSCHVPPPPAPPTPPFLSLCLNSRPARVLPSPPPLYRSAVGAAAGRVGRR